MDSTAVSDCEQISCSSSTEESAENPMNSILERTMTSNTVKQQIRSISFITDSLLKEKSIFFEMRQFYHYFTVLAETAVQEQYLHSTEENLSKFFSTIIDVCYQWKCLEDSYENDFRFFNCIQLTLKSILETVRKTNANNNVINRCIPLVLSSMIVIVSTIHGLKEVALISRPISQLIVDRKKSGLNISSDEWKRLFSQVLSVANIWTMICLIEKLDDKAFSNVVVSLFDYALGNDPFIRHIARKTIKSLSIERHVSLDELFIEYQFEISAHIIRLINIKSHFDINLLHESMALFGISSLPRELLRHIVPHFAIKCDQSTRLVIDEIAKIDDKPVQYVIKIYFNEIVRDLFYGNNFDRNVQNINKVIDFLSEYSEYDLKYRMKVFAYDMVNSFLLLFSKDYYSTLEALAFVYHFQRSNGENNMNLKFFYNNEQSLRNYLREYFLPFIHKLDAFMMNFAITNREKITAVESFVLLIKLMGNECINTFRVKIFATIKLIISERFYSNPNLIKLSIEALMQFIKMMDDLYLSTQLLTISALILPLMHFWPSETSSLFKELVINRRSSPQFQSAFKHLYFIPEIQELSQVNEVLKPYLSYSNSEEDVRKAIILVVNNINHENNKVQEFSLRELRRLLKKHQLLLYKLCNDIKEESCDHFVNNIVLNLMYCFKSTDSEVLLLVAECLGVLGAIDPSRIDLDKPIISKEEKCEHFLSPIDKNFKIKLITLLMRAITTAAKTDDQYCASYALQEIIKYCTNPSTVNPIDINQDLPQELRDYCAVLQKTRYKQKPEYKSSQETTEAIFGSSPDLSYNEWLNKWLSTLFYSYIFGEENSDSCFNDRNAILSQCNPSQTSGESYNLLEESLAKHVIPIDILNASFLALLRNQPLAQFFLPFVVITALKNATQAQRLSIVNEVKTIITKLTTDGTIFSGETGHLSSQTVFRLYDHLKVWSKKRSALHRRVSKTARQLRTAQLSDREFKGVKFFLQNISTLELATLAFNCNAFSRSLRYLEDYVKETDMEFSANSSSFQDEISFFQRIFIRLDEPDSVEGCNSKRIKNASISETILTHEAAGQIQEALICCAKAIQVFPNEFEYQEKYLQTSMESFDQSEMVYTYGTGLVIKQPEWRRKIAPYVIEAAWKLSSWDGLEKLLQEHEDTSFATFGSGIGDLFFSMIKKREINEIEEKLTFLRRQLVGPLSAAAMEISGYVRGHQYIVNLHILNDIQLAYNKLMTKFNDECFEIENFRSKFLRVVKVWDERNNMVRKTIKCQEPILNAQRALFSIIDRECDFLSSLIKKELFKSWLMSTKTSRKSGNIQRSYNCLLEMNKARQSLVIDFGAGDIPLSVISLSDIENSDAIIEAAKVHWARGDRKGAIKYLKDEIEQNFSESRRQCYVQAVSGLNDRQFSSDELTKIANSLSIDIPSTNQSSSTCSSASTIRSTASSYRSERSQHQESHEAFAKLQLLYTKYCDKFGALSLNTLALMYKSVTIAYPNWEESHYNLGMYCNKIFVNYEESQRNSKSYSLGKPEEILDLKGRVVKSLAESLKYGVKHAHNSLPRLLNIWFDLGTELFQFANKSRTSNASQMLMNEIKKTLERVTSAINDLITSVPSYIFFVSFAQLTSRILHPNAVIAKTLKTILAKLIRDFPQQSMWLLIRSINSNNINRRLCCQDILGKAIKEDPNGVLQQFIQDISKFAKLLNEMCQKGPEATTGNPRNRSSRVKQMSFKKDFPELNKLFSNNSGFSPILLPFHSLVNVTLPKSILKTDHKPFPLKDVYIRSFDDCIELLNSLQKPKKIKILGSDGKCYIILCKPGDDLRKDHCLIEFSNLLNRCFKRDPETRRRQLRIKTYLVVPLSDSGGIIEWIPGLSPYRGLIETQYKNSCDYDDIRELVIRNYPTLHVSKAERVRVFQSDILPKFKPSVFSQWFVTNYTDPLSWFSARLSYIRSSAVFSIVGYLLGLGDRHGENIMIDESSGETVHVDFNCLFNKGEEFQYPERVPFRLTHNMVNAMGVTEFEGTFRKACEHALRVARDNKEALMNFVSPFRFDHFS